MVADGNNCPLAVNQAFESSVYIHLHLIPFIKGEVPAIDKTADKTVCLSELIDHVAEIHEIGRASCRERV